MAGTASRIRGKPLELQPRFQRATEDMTRLLIGCVCQTTDWEQGAEQVRQWDTDTAHIAPFVSFVQGTAPMLYERLRHSAAWDCFTNDMQDYVQAQHTLNGQRMAMWQASLHSVLREANVCGIEMLLMKGSHLALTHYANPAERVMADIDLLVEPNALHGAAEAITAVGYATPDVMQRHLRFAGRSREVVSYDGEHPDNPMDIELHVRLGDLCLNQAVDLTELLRTCRHSTTMGDARAAILTEPALFVYLLLHSGANVMRHTWRLIQLIDLVLVAQRLDAADWAEVQRLVNACGGAWWAYAPAQVVANYASGVIPINLLGAWRHSAPVAVRREAPLWGIADVSLSNLRRLSLHDRLRWARSPRHAALYLLQKMIPTPAQVQDYAAWQHQPSGRAHAYRAYYRTVLRWLRPSYSSPIHLRDEEDMEFYRKIRW